MPRESITVVFDLDGTLVDTAPDLIRALNVVMASLSLPSADVVDLRGHLGQGARALVTLSCARHGLVLDDAELSARTRHLIDAYAQDIALYSRPYPGVAYALSALQSEGASLSVCTNKTQALATALLSALQLEQYFHAVIGADRVQSRKPNPLHLFEAIRAAGGSAHRALMVGDSLTDVATARAAEIPVLVFQHGYSDVPVESLGADALFRDFCELPSIVGEMSGRLLARPPAGSGF